MKKIKGVQGSLTPGRVWDGAPRFALMAALIIALFPLIFATHADAAVFDVALGESISAVIDRASPGDVIRIAPGTYREALTVTKPNLTITSTAPPGAEPDVVIDPKLGPALTDRHNTTWRGIAFRTDTKEGAIAELLNFSGRVEYCRFDSGEAAPGKLAIVTSGKGTFHGTVFANQDDQTEGVQILSGSPTFTYCRFENLAGGAVQIKSGSALFQNCLFVRNKHVINRLDAAATAELTNSVLFLNQAPSLFIGEAKSPVLLSHSLFTPARQTATGGNFAIYGSLETLGNVKIENTTMQSPRFTSLRRRALLNLGIDDSRCIPLWSQIAQEADKYKYPVTIAVHVLRTTEQHITLLNRGIERGHEIASHGVSHAPFNLAGGLELSYDAGEGKSAYIGIGDDDVLKFFADDRLRLEIPLGTPESAMSDDASAPSLGDVRERLRKVGVEASLTDDSYRDVLATFLIRVPRFDLNFKNFSPTLGLQTNRYMAYEIHTSRERLNAMLKFAADDVFALVYPYTEYNRLIAAEADKAGYLCARAGHTADTFSPYTDGFDPYRIYADSIKNQISPPDLPADKMRAETLMILDFINDAGAAMTLYSHAENELSLANWKVLLKTVQEDNAATPMKLVDLSERVKSMGQLKDGRYFLPLPEDMSDYRPRAESPLRGTGKPLSLTHDFEGKPITTKTPNIGLYE